jgi:hypothetical protein
MSLVKNPWLALVGLVSVGLVAMKLFTGDLTVWEAAVRVGTVTAGLVLTERLLLPVAKGLLGPGHRDT